MGCQARILKGPSGETTKEKEINLVAVGCNARAAGHAPAEQGDRRLSVEVERRGNILARGRLGRAHADLSGQCRASTHLKHLRTARSRDGNHTPQQ